jgi:hypothetical protein
VSTDFNEEILKEHNIFELSKKQEMKEMLQTYSDGQVDMYRKAIEDWDRVSDLGWRRISPRLVTNWVLVIRSSPYFNASR